MFGSSKEPSGTVVQISREKSRTILAVVAASVISLVVWGLVVALNVR
jgi:flagellar biosynthesis protein FliQ